MNEVAPTTIKGIPETVIADKEEVNTIQESEEDSRVLLTQQNIAKYNNSPDCKEKFNNDDPVIQVTYKNKMKGISFNVPYNPKWGNEKYRISPYEESNYASVGGPDEIVLT